MKSRWSNEEVILAYKDTGSVWKAAKQLGLSGQTIHERLQSIGYPLANRNWTAEEEAELAALAGEMTITQIASRLGRPYNGIAMKISRLGLGVRYGNNQPKKPKRSTLYSKSNLVQYLKEIDEQNVKLTKYSKSNGLDVETLTQAIQSNHPEWWDTYAEMNASKPKASCPYCAKEFWPQSAKQIYCNRKCGSDSRTDKSYFGGRRRETIGLAERVCQLCARKDVKGLSSHHMIGKENDPENEMLIALCPGCHNLVTLLGGRSFVGTSEIWEGLIQLAMIRKHGANKNFIGVSVSVDIEMLTDADVAEMDDFFPQAH
jgi:transposase-like protein